MTSIVENLAMLADISDGMLVVVLLVAAAILFLVEVCTPTFGLVAAVGLASMIAGVVFAFRIGPLVGVIVMLGCIIGAPCYLYFMVKLLPNTPLGKKLFLKKAPDASRQATPEADKLAELVGKIGVADSPLRPSGTIRIGDMRVVALAEHEMIEKGQAVKVIKAHGTDVVVRLVEEDV